MYSIILSIFVFILQMVLDEPPKIDSIPLTAPECEIEFVYENSKVIITIDHFEFLGIFVTYPPTRKYVDLIADVVWRDRRLFIKGLDVDGLNDKGELIKLPGDPNDIMINDLAHRNYKRNDGYFFWQSK